MGIKSATETREHSLHAERNIDHKNILHAGMDGKMGAKFCDNFVSGKQFGRFSLLALPNIGRCTIVHSRELNARMRNISARRQMVAKRWILRLCSEVPHRSVGAYLNVGMATVGRNMTIRIASCELFFPKHGFNQIVDLQNGIDAILTCLCHPPKMYTSSIAIATLLR